MRNEENINLQTALNKAKSVEEARAIIAKAKAKAEAKAKKIAKAEADALSKKRRTENARLAAQGELEARHEKEMEMEAQWRRIETEAYEATTGVNVEAYASTMKEVMRTLGVINCRHNLIDGFTQVVFAEGEQEFSARALNAMFSALYEAEATEEQEEQSESDAFIAWALS